MKAVFAAVLAALALTGAAPAAAPHKEPQFTTLDACALQGRGSPIGDGAVCLKVTGGVSYWQSWGNAMGGYYDDPTGKPVVTTPAGIYSIPTPR